MTTYVFGAGASRHAGYPLASELGIALRDWIYINKPIDHGYRIHIDQLCDAYGSLDNIEQILTDLDESAPSSIASGIERPIRARVRGNLRMAIRDFFNDIRKAQAPLYCQWAREWVRPGDFILTFNYDSACERELRRADLWEIGNGYGFSLNIPALPSTKVSVLKLHGSTNWWALMFDGNTGFQQISDSIGVKPVIFFQPDFEFLGYPAEVRDSACVGIHQATWWPAIIMPTLQKHFFEQTPFGREWEQFWQCLWGEAECVLRSSNEIVVIGYGMAAADKRATELLLNTSNREARVTVYCGRSTAEICKRFAARGFEDVETSGEGRFEDFLSQP